MGTWGSGLYQDDIARDIRDFYTDQLRRGKEGAAITQELLAQSEDILSDEEDAAIFWFALADTQWEFGRLEDFVKRNALHCIKSQRDSMRWLREEPVTARQTVILKVEQKLNSPQPAEKKVSSYHSYQCDWKFGDVFAYPLDSEFAKENHLLGRYFLLYKVDETAWYPNHVVPIVWVKITNDARLPQNQAEFDVLDFVQISRIPYVDKYWIPNTSATPKEQAQESNRVKALVDENGCLKEFRVRLLNTSKRVIPKSIFWAGNFQNIKPPALEYVPYDMAEVSSIAWKFFDRIMIDRYQYFSTQE